MAHLLSKKSILETLLLEAPVTNQKCTSRSLGQDLSPYELHIEHENSPQFTSHASNMKTRSDKSEGRPTTKALTMIRAVLSERRVFVQLPFPANFAVKGARHELRRRLGR
jgi:hypothetical protein